MQRRLAGEALERYTLPFGGGYYFVPPTTAARCRPDDPGRHRRRAGSTASKLTNNPIGGTVRQVSYR
ncbi:hypothetical protein J2S42_000454 [Catenuloplanes indicus]|uniref:Uncharacterized protein n=1 Tax=Catenuloplanes indicus TaxID=137267 RepID=A0AAE3VUB3_9ACTN|nr:hypothetical protein [Catenuloplanes indicus]MDQ0363785.1 hypothetical protein [Catenuloplanes indicus]